MHETVNFEKAIADYTVVIRLKPNYADGEAYYDRGLAYSKKGQTANAEKDFEQAEEARVQEKVERGGQQAIPERPHAATIRDRPSARSIHRTTGQALRGAVQAVPTPSCDPLDLAGPRIVKTWNAAGTIDKLETHRSRSQLLACRQGVPAGVTSVRTPWAVTNKRTWENGHGGRTGIG